MKKKLKYHLQTKIVPYLLQLLVRFIYLTSKKTFHHSSKIDQDINYVVAMWHGDLLMQPLNYRKLKPKGSIKVIVSEHKDGEAIAKVVSYLGVGKIPGSSSKGAVKAFINALKTLKKGDDVAITPDGPRGPIYSVADGIVSLSQKTNTKIITLSCIPSKYWQFKSWDKFIVPKPFGTIDFYAGEPFDVEGLEMEDAKKVIYEKLMENQLEK